MRIALCLLTLNELAGCKHDIPLIKKIRNSFEQIFVVDNGSYDGTIEYLKQQKITVYSKPGITYNAMHLLAVEKCKADAIIFFHPKGTIPVTDTLKFNKFFDMGYELVVASRIMKGSANEEDVKLFKTRKWLTVSLAFIAALIWKRSGNIVWDVLHGFRGATVKGFKKMNPGEKGRTIDIEEVIESYRKDIRRIEFPTKEKLRLSGKTHFKTIPFGIEILKYLLKKIFKLSNYLAF